ncbi:MAG: single-stranded DNA-binding protein [Actinomycetia bacterium]|nr:single-stranded DNA-binding protein [Actinomycetes bacterium]
MTQAELDPGVEVLDDPREATVEAATEGDEGDLLVAEGDIAADYLERLLDVIDYDGDIDLDVENGRAVVAIVGNNLKSLVGARGETLDALQELTRLAVAQKTGVRSRLMLDISGYRKARRGELTKLARASAARVVADGAPVRLEPMNPFERKVVHDAVAAIDGVRSESEGEGPARRVVVWPAVDGS